MDIRCRNNSVLTSALDLADAGVPVFPCSSDKRPACPHGFLDAATDRAALCELWHDCPGDLIGAATGNISGIDVLDLDAKHEAARAWWRDNRDRMPPTRVHRTRSGGLHVLFRHADTMR